MSAYKTGSNEDEKSKSLSNGLKTASNIVKTPIKVSETKQKIVNTANTLKTVAVAPVNIVKEVIQEEKGEIRLNTATNRNKSKNVKLQTSTKTEYVKKDINEHKTKKEIKKGKKKAKKEKKYNKKKTLTKEQKRQIRNRRIKKVGKALNTAGNIAQTEDPKKNLEAQLKTLAKPITWTAKKITKKPRQKISNWINDKKNNIKKKAKNGVKAIVKAGVKGAKATGEATLKLLKALGSLIVSFWWVFLIIGAVVILLFSLTSFIGGDKEKNKLEGIFDRLNARQEERYQAFMNNEAKAGLNLNYVPDKSEFEGISDKEYKEIIKDWKKDEYYCVNVPQRDFTAIGYLCQNAFLDKTDDNINWNAFESTGRHIVDHDGWETYQAYPLEEEFEITWTYHTSTDEKKDKPKEMKKTFTRKVNQVMITNYGISECIDTISKGISNKDTCDNGHLLSEYYDFTSETGEYTKNMLLACASENDTFLDKFDDRFKTGKVFNLPTIGGGTALGVGKYTGSFEELCQNNNYAVPNLYGQNIIQLYSNV